MEDLASCGFLQASPRGRDTGTVWATALVTKGCQGEREQNKKGGESRLSKGTPVAIKISLMKPALSLKSTTLNNCKFSTEP